ncbi:LysR substrate-binding domain-containing protein, partial [Acinetobacter baumannii]
LLAQKDQLEQEMQRFKSSTTQALTLWCNSSAQSEYLPPLLPQYLVLHPEMSIDLHEAESSEIVDALTQGIASLGLVSSF